MALFEEDAKTSLSTWIFGILWVSNSFLDFLPNNWGNIVVGLFLLSMFEDKLYTIIRNAAGQALRDVFSKHLSIDE